MVLGDMVAMETGLLCLCDPLEPLPVLLVLGDIPTTLQMVEDPKFYAHATVLLLKRAISVR